MTWIFTSSSFFSSILVEKLSLHKGGSFFAIEYSSKIKTTRR